MATSTRPSPEDTSSSGGGALATASRGLSEVGLGRIFLTPSFAVMALIALFPVLYAVYQSLFNIRGFNEDFIGAGNYTEALASAAFWRAAQNTLVITVVSVGLEFVIGMAFALIMNKAFVGRGVTRAIILVPWVIPTAVAGVVWRYMFDPNPGFANFVLGTDINWLREPFWTISGIIVADVWKTAPFVALLLLAGLQTIPGDVYESAKVDGANPVQTFWRITLPLLKPAIVVALLFRTVDALRMFDLPYIFNGYSLQTATLSVYAQRFLVAEPRLGYANALSTLTFILVMAVGIFFISRLGRDIISAPGED